MTRARWIGAVALLVGVGAASTAQASAWTREPWHFYLQLGTSYTFASNAFNVEGARVPIRVREFAGGDSTPNQTPSNFQQLLSDLYFELGIGFFGDRVTLFGDLPWVSQRQLNDHTGHATKGDDIVYSANGVGDMLFGLRTLILKAPLAIAIETRLTLPTGNVQAVVPTGQGDVRGEMRAVFSKGFERVPIYLDFEFGYTLRGHTSVTSLIYPAPGLAIAYSPEVVLHGEIGAALLRWKYDRVVLIAMAEYRRSTDPLPKMDVGFTSIIPDTSALLTVGGNLLVFVFKNAGLNLRFSQAVLGNRLPSITVAGAGLFFTY